MRVTFAFSCKFSAKPAAEQARNKQQQAAGIIITFVVEVLQDLPGIRLLITFPQIYLYFIKGKRNLIDYCIILYLLYFIISLYIGTENPSNEGFCFLKLLEFKQLKSFVRIGQNFKAKMSL